jgi:hypothetical protein
LVVARHEHRRILELAGDRRALLAAAPLVGDEIVVPWYETELAPSARAAGWESRDFPLMMGSQWLEAPPRPRPIPWYGLNYV